MSNYSVTSSSELMLNYLQADILQPQHKFLALQTDLGASLLFSIGTDNVLYVTQETPAKPGVAVPNDPDADSSRYGWSRSDLSSAQIKRDLPSGATCKDFGAAQQVGTKGQPAQIHLAMVVNDGTNDHLYLSLGNSDGDTSWTQKPTWTPCPFNAVDAQKSPVVAPSPFLIPGVFISEATDGEFIVVDVVRNPSDGDPLVSRYYIDVANPASPVWTPHDVAFDLEAASYSSCLGRAAKAHGVDGLYTIGKAASSAQFVYTPLWNVIDDTLPPAASALNLPGGLIPEAIAACRNADNTSDLYAVSGGGLYYFASTNQTNHATAVQLLSNDLLKGVRALFASAEGGNVTVWGLNGSDEVFYLACPAAQVASGGAWRLPITILSGVDAISPYTDREYSANTFFAHSSDGLVKAIKSPTNGLWNRRNVTLPPSDVKQDAIEISSFTTHLQVNGPDGRPAAGVDVLLTAANLTSVYINHLYYIVGPTAITVPTDAQGAVTIVETAHTLAATRFSATVAGQPLSVNPMDAPFQRNAALNTVDSLKAAVITNRDGTTRPFIPADTPPDQLQAVAASNDGLSKSYASLTSNPAPRAMAGAMALAGPRPLAGRNLGDQILTDLGDLFNWLASGVEAVVHVIEDVAGEVWHFVAEIAGKVYYGILDAVEKVVAAAMWIYNAIKVAIEDIIEFLKFLFAWEDIKVTHEVIKNVFTQFVQEAIDGLTSAEAGLASLFQKLQADMNKWADIPGFDQTPSSTNGSNPPLPDQHSAPANLGVHHFKGNFTSGSTDFSPVGPAEAIFKDLLDLLDQERTTLTNAYDAIKDVVDQFDQLSATQIVKKLLAIVVDTMLQTAQNILEAVLKVLIQLVEGMMAVLTATIDIPVVSTLYKMISGDDLSILDVICLVAAIPATLVYKAVAGSAPFPKGDGFTNGLLNATNFDGVRQQFHASTPHAAVRARAFAASAAQDPVLDQAKLKVFGVVTGVVAFFGSVVLALVQAVQKALDAIGLDAAYPKMLAAVGCVANVAYVSPNIATLINAKTDNWYSQMNNVLTGISILKGIAAIPLATTENKAIQMMFPGVETLINIVWNVPVSMNIYVNRNNWNTTYKSLIPESIGNYAFNIGGMMELPIALVKDIKAKAILVLVQSGFMVGYGVFMVIAGGIYEGAANQEH